MMWSQTEDLYSVLWITVTCGIYVQSVLLVSDWELMAFESGSIVLVWE